MQRAPNPWDRFYRYHEAPWRGERQIADLEPWLDGRLLELGCGNGKLLRPLLAAGHDVVGLDISFHALRRLGTGVLADAARLPFVDGAFGTVLDVHCTGHLLAKGRLAAFQEARRVGKTLVVERLALEDMRAGQGDEPEAGTRRLQDGRTTHFSNEADLSQELEAAGWQVDMIRRETRTMRLRGQGATRAWVRAVAVNPRRP